MKRLWILVCFCILLVAMSGCESTGTSKEGKGAAGIDSLNVAQLQQYQQALAELDQQQPQAAEKLLSDLIKERHDVAEIWVNLALSQYQQNKWQTLEKSVQRVLTHFPDAAPGHNLAGLLAVENGKFAEAQQHYSQALKINPDYSQALFNMALLQDVYLQNIQAAVDYYTRYLRNVEDEATKAWTEHLSQTLAQ